MDWNEVVNYCVSSKCIPTLLFYEEVIPVKNKKNDEDRFLIDQESLDML